MKEKEIVLKSVLQKPLNTSTEGHLVVLLAEYVIKTVLTVQYSPTAIEDMLWTGPSAMAVECACTIALPITLPLRMGLYMVSVHAVEYVQRSVQIVWMDMSLKRTSSLT